MANIASLAGKDTDHIAFRLRQELPARTHLCPPRTLPREIKSPALAGPLYV